MKRLFFLLVLLWAAPVWGQALTQTPNLGLYLIPFGYPNYHIPINDNTAILDTKVTTLNLACNDGEVPTWAKGKFSVCGTGAGVNPAANIAWTGTHTFTIAPKVNGVDICLEDGTNCPGGADADITAIGALAGTGFATRIGADTWAQRSLAVANSSNLTLLNPLGISGNPTFDVGPNIFLTTRSHTQTAGDVDFGAAASLAIAKAAGCAPTIEGRICTNTSTHRPVFGNGTTTKVFAFTDEIQPLNSLLTSLSATTGLAGEMLFFTGPTTFARTSGLATSCPADGTHAWNTSANGTWVCGALNVGLTGIMVSGTIPKGASASTLTPSIITESAGSINIAGSLVVNCTSDCISFDTSAYAGHVPYSIVFPYVGASASVAMTTGTLTPDDIVKVGANGQLISGGPGGTGTATDSNAKNFTNLTLNTEGTGNVITLVSVIQLDFASCSGGTAGLQWDDDAGGDAQPTAACNDTGSNQRPTADFSGTATNSVVRTLRLPKGWTGNVDFKLRYVSTGSGGGNVRWQVSTLCRAVGESWDAAFNAAQTIVDAAAADNILNDATQTALTLTGCGPEEDMTLKVSRTGADGADTNEQLAKALYAWVTLRWVNQSQ